MDAFRHSLQENIQSMQLKIAASAASRSIETHPVTLIAVTKTQPASTVRAAIDCGLRVFGENYVQEGVDKIIALNEQGAALVWHMIGPLQSNKTKLVAEHFDWVHTIDRLKIAQRLSDQRPADLAPLNVLIQVNTDQEPTKSGVLAHEVGQLAAEIASLSRLKLRGLMCIPSANDSTPAFRQLRDLYAALKISHPSLDTLSMGMSQDFEMAISEGATHVRVGSALFGARAP